jgi:antitoxin component YwqK of YwqJK toxin-antitoxin module
MKNLLLFAVLVTLPLLLGGCGEKEISLEWRKDIVYLKGSDTPYTGKVSRFHHENGQKRSEGNYKDGKAEGLWVSWHENGQKSWEGNLKEGEEVEGSAKYWNSKGEPVDTIEEARK